MKKTYRIAPEVKEQILKRIKEEGISVEAAAKDAGIHNTTIYNWLGKGATAAPSWSEYAKIRRENKALLELVGQVTLQLSESQKKI